jgi:imidazolonepropionase-like amidohydrolase
MSRLAILIALVSCSAPRAEQPLAPAPKPVAAKVPSPSPPPALSPPMFITLPPVLGREPVRFVLHKFLLEVGFERDTYVTLPGGGVEAKAVFSYRDRGTTVPLAAALEIDKDGRIRRFAAWGRTSRSSTLDDRIELAADGGYDVSHDGKSRHVAAATAFAVVDGYAPMLLQDLAFRAWNQHGRPALIAMLPEGELAIASRGKETYDGPAGKVTLEHLSVTGVVWGVEDVWLDDQGRLAAVITRDAEFDHHEAARDGFEALLPALAAASGADGVARLAEAIEARSGTIALVGATLVDGTGRAPVADAVVVIDGDRIVGAGPRGKVAIPPGATPIDVAGKTIVPGLWDMHAHVEQVEQGAAYLGAGITTVRDMGNVLPFITSVRDAIDAGKGLGPRILVDGIVDGVGERALGTVRIRTREDIAPVIDSLRKARCIEVKLYSSIAPELVRPIVAYAHAHGMRAVGHVPEHMKVQQAIDAGYDSISHAGYLFDVFPDVKTLSAADTLKTVAAFDLASPAMTKQIAAVVAHHVVIDDTVSLFEQFLVPAAELAKREPGVATLPRELRSTLGDLPESMAPDGAKVIAKYVELLRLLHERGAILVAGTDIGVPGHSLHRELELYVSAGFTPMQALQAATLVPARYMHLDKELGTVEAGKRADLVVLDGDPLASISAVRKTALVVRRGRVYDSHALWRLAGFDVR